jgi:hypothetical protein
MPEKADHSYVLCIDDGGYPESLEVRKVYVTLRDRRAEERKYARIIDETGQDYLYPASLFVPIQVPAEADQLMSVGYWEFKSR